MKNLRRVPLAVALLVGLCPMAAIAAEARLSPNTNGGSGAMPSGYTDLYFDLADGDWTDQLALPANPRPGDMVLLTSHATAPARLDAANTAFSDLEYLSVDPGTHVAFFWDTAAQGWIALDGRSARLLQPAHGEREIIVPQSGHAITQLHDNGWGYTAVRLPVQAPGGAQLSISGSQRSDIQVRHNGDAMSCPAAMACAYVFDASERRWRARSGRTEITTAHVDLPAPTHRWTTLVVGSASEDMHTPSELRLPAAGVDGDIYQVSNSSGDHFAYILTDNTTLFEAAPVSSGPHTFRFDASRSTWVEQPK